MVDLGISIEGQGAQRVVYLDGECDIATAPKLKEAFDTLRDPEVRTILLDATNLHFLDSTGLGVIIGAFKRVREAGGDLTICGAHGAVLRVLEVTGLDRIIPLKTNTAEA